MYHHARVNDLNEKTVTSSLVNGNIFALVFHQSTVNALAPSSVYSILPHSIHPRLLSCICVFFLFTAMHVKRLAFCVWEWE